MNAQQIILIISFFGAAFLLIFKMGKENKVFYFAGALFGLIGAFRLIQMFTGQLFQGPVFAWSVRIILLIALLYMCFVYYKEAKHTARKRQECNTEDEVEK